jgi:hydrophobe/amphiphile efflux-1 (HAE1) family protein
VIRKANSNILMLVALSSDNPRFDSSFLSNYAKLYVEDELKRVPGVGNTLLFGGSEFSMLLDLDPGKMAQLGITVSDVTAAVREQSSTKPAGRLGREPAPEGTQLTIPVTTSGRLTTPEQFGNIIVRSRPDGSLVRVRDVAEVRLGSLSYDSETRLNGKPISNLLVYSRPGANDLEVRDAVVSRMEELSQSFPAGMGYTVPFDTTPFISESVREVVKTLVEAMILVTLVVFLFLESWRATLIPMIAVPVSIIGTFLGLQALGFTINTLTLFGLVLAIGIVVDDAIVVIENVERIMEEEHLPPRQAADKAIRQVASALVAIVLSLSAVFVPVAFLSGITGALYKEFALTIVIAIVISGIVALTLTPALCATVLQHSTAETTNRFFKAFNRGFERSRRRYLGAAGWILDRPRRGVTAFLVMVVLAGLLYKRVPSAFVPAEDKGFYLLAVQLPDAASLQRTREVVSRIEQIALSDSSVNTAVTLLGLDILNFSNSTNAAALFVGLKPWSERRRADQSLDAILQRLNGRLFGVKDAVAFAFNFPEVPGLGRTSGLELNLQAREGQNYRDLVAEAQRLAREAGALPEFTAAATLARANVPQLFVEVDEEAARARGVGSGQVFSTLQAMLSTLYINDFNIYGRTYRVQAGAQSQFRQTPEDVGRFYVRSDRGDMIPLSALVTSEMRAGPSVISKVNGFPSALITGSPAPGRGTGEMYDAVERLMAESFEPNGYGFAYSGQSYQERVAGGGGGMVIVLGLILVFLVLAAQYESWAIPFAVLLGVPFGMFGALLGIWLRGTANDVYFQIGMIAVIGLAAKNAILIVEFANTLHSEGLSIREAAIEAARQRLRPILMTSFAFILGVSPLVVASGAGAVSRHSIGTGVFSGVLIATLVGIFFIPLFFALVRGAADRGLLYGKMSPDRGR